MFIEGFVRRKLLGFQVNRAVRTFIFAEMFMWAGWNFFFPLLGVYIVTKIPGSALSVVSLAFSFYLFSRVFFEIVSARYLNSKGDQAKLVFTIVGELILGLAYLGFLLVDSESSLLLVYMFVGLGLGISTPAKFSIFARHLDKDKETSEWSYDDALSLGGMAVSGAIGGIVATAFGFEVLFVGASILNLVGVAPYLYLLKKYKKSL